MRRMNIVQPLTRRLVVRRPATDAVPDPSVGRDGSERRPLRPAVEDGSATAVRRQVLSEHAANGALPAV